MKKGKIEKFSLATISAAVSRSGLESAKAALSFARGSMIDISGKVRKVGRREGICRLVVEPGDVPGFVVIADCLADAEKVKARKIRKGSSVELRGRFESFGSLAVCLSDCRLI